jgi:5-dehydro-4-deoxyglucarate dehydratase
VSETRPLSESPSEPLTFDGILFFPVTPFTAAGEVDRDVLAEHIHSKLPFAPGGMFPACGTGELHALSVAEAAVVVETAVVAAEGRIPVVAGAGGPLGSALELARNAERAGADALLMLPPYLVQGPAAGLNRYIEELAAATSLPVIVYSRGNARFSAGQMRELAANPKVIGFKDGLGDIGLAQQVSLAVREVRPDFLFFNGLLTAELSQGAYRGIGMPLYSSAAFAFLPEVANLYYRAYAAGDEDLRNRLLREFYVPLVALRDETPGFGVSLIKAGCRLRGLEVGGVRAPLVDPSPEQLQRLERLIETGLALAEELA